MCCEKNSLNAYNNPVKDAFHTSTLLNLFLRKIEAFAIFCCAQMPRKIPKQREGD